MKYLRIKAPPQPKIRHGARLAIFFLALGVLSLTAAQTVFADGGGWPTLTPTFVLFPTFTPTPTTAAYPYPKALPVQMQSALPSPTFFLPTQAETSSGSSFVCWPFALALLLVVILGSTVIFRRVKT